MQDPQDPTVVVGALARIESNHGRDVRKRLCHLDGVSTFEIADPERVGVLIESTELDAAHDTFERVSRVDGVLGAWPISLEIDDGHGDSSTTD